MSYTVLARKWRPKRFSELVGQQHAKTTLVNALDQGRLHHAYLFTGTRGVGKTSIARIFAKSLNCESGTSADPCGKCSVCTAIDSGNYVDLIEIDAASRTRVEDTREILDNVPYAPTQGRYKVYLIDEVHMLSKHSFNALLKTLEEPPSHVKFLLATTDPQKLPITILSRCLQFNLKALSRSEISQQLSYVLAQEGLAFEEEAVALLAKAANGSMRDSLSLTDQAVASCQGTLTLAIVQEMLGTIDKQFSRRLLSAVLSGEAEQAFTVVREIAEFAPDYKLFTDDLLSVLHLAAMSQLIENAARLSADDAIFIKQIAAQLSAQDIQLLYQIVLHGKRDLLLAPEPMIGFEMLVMRLLAFSPMGPVTPLKQEIPAPSETHTLVFTANTSASSAPVQSQSDTSSTTSQAVPPSDTAHSQLTQDSPSESSSLTKATDTPAISESVEPVTYDEEFGSTAALPEDETQDDREIAALNAQQAEILNQANTLVEPLATEPPAESPPSSSSDEPALSPIDAILQRRQQINRAESHTSKTPQSNVATSQPAQTDAKETNALSTHSDDSTTALCSTNAENATVHTRDSDDSAEVTTLEATPPVKKPEPEIQLAHPKQDKKAVSKIVDFQEKLQQRGITPIAPEPSSEPTPEHSATSGQTVSDEGPRYAYLECEYEALESDESDDSLTDEEKQQVDSVLGPRSAADIDEWSGYIKQMQLKGLARQFVLNATYQIESGQVRLLVEKRHQHLDKPIVREYVESALLNIIADATSVVVEFVDDAGETPMRIQSRLNQERIKNAQELAKSDSNIQALEAKFSGFLDEATVIPR